MIDTEKKQRRGRPRRFDPEEAVATAQQLFHARGYDAVGVAEVTDALGIKPPSFYAAFGSKAGLYNRVLDRWTETGAIPFAEILTADRPVADALSSLLEEAARRYAGDAEAAGCLVIEGTRCNDPDARAAACSRNVAAEAGLREYIARRHPQQADSVADFVSTTMSGMSAKARNGHGLEQLLSTAKLASAAIRQALAD